MSDTATLGGQSCTAGTNEHVAAGVGFYHSSIYNNNNTTRQRFIFRIGEFMSST